MSRADVDNPELVQVFKMATEMHFQNTSAPSLFYMAFHFMITYFISKSYVRICILHRTAKPCQKDILTYFAHKIAHIFSMFNKIFVVRLTYDHL